MTVHYVEHAEGATVFEVLGAASADEALRSAACEAGLDTEAEAREALRLVDSTAGSFRIYTMQARAQLLLTDEKVAAYVRGELGTMAEVEWAVQRLADETGRTAEAIAPGRLRAVVALSPRARKES